MDNSNLDTLKLKMDEAIFLDWHRARVECVLRDDQGLVIMATTKLELNISDPLEVELLTLFLGL